jgi:hypothetical protein
MYSTNRSSIRSSGARSIRYTPPCFVDSLRTAARCSCTRMGAPKGCIHLLRPRVESGLNLLGQCVAQVRGVSTGLETKKKTGGLLDDRWGDGGMHGPRCADLLLCLFCVLMRPVFPFSFVEGVDSDARCDVHGLNRSFDSGTCSPSGFPPGFQGTSPSQVDRTTSCDDLSASRLPSRSVSTSRLVTPCVQGTNASDLAAATLASPAGSTPAVLSAMAGAASAIGNARGFKFPRIRVLGHASTSERVNDFTYHR